MKHIVFLVLFISCTSAFGQILNYVDLKTIYKKIGTTEPASLLLSKDFILKSKKLENDRGNYYQNGNEVWAYNSFNGDQSNPQIWVEIQSQKIIINGEPRSVSYRLLRLEFSGKSTTYNYLISKIKGNSIQSEIVDQGDSYVQVYVHKDDIVFYVVQLISGVLRI
jgi:hypothetical protein